MNKIDIDKLYYDFVAPFSKIFRDNIEESNITKIEEDNYHYPNTFIMCDSDNDDHIIIDDEKEYSELLESPECPDSDNYDNIRKS